MKIFDYYGVDQFNFTCPNIDPNTIMIELFHVFANNTMKKIGQNLQNNHSIKKTFTINATPPTEMTLLCHSTSIDQSQTLCSHEDLYAIRFLSTIPVVPRNTSHYLIKYIILLAVIIIVLWSSVLIYMCRSIRRKSLNNKGGCKQLTDRELAMANTNGLPTHQTDSQLRQKEGTSV